MFSIFSGDSDEESTEEGSTGLAGSNGESSSDGEPGKDGQSATKESSGNKELLAKIDELIGVIKQGGDVKLDGRKVGETMFLGRTPAGA